jgi:hypothetical protein
MTVDSAARQVANHHDGVLPCFVPTGFRRRPPEIRLILQALSQLIRVLDLSQPRLFFVSMSLSLCEIPCVEGEGITLESSVTL